MVVGEGGQGAAGGDEGERVLVLVINPFRTTIAVSLVLGTIQSNLK